MLQRYGIATRLVIVIQTIQLNRETGMLIAKRGGGISSEEGRIVFTNGRVTEVQVSRRSASDAFNYMSMWENCQASFIPQDPSRSIVHLFEKASQTAPIVSEEQRKSDNSSGVLPKGARPIHGHHQGQSHVTPTTNLSLSLTPPIQEPMLPIPVLLQPLPTALRRIEQMGLSRAHRQLILLINGSRSMEDLATMMGRTVENIQDLSQDLKRLGMI